jgi:hypothetical protein
MTVTFFKEIKTEDLWLKRSGRIMNMEFCVLRKWHNFAARNEKGKKENRIQLCLRFGEDSSFLREDRGKDEEPCEADENNHGFGICISHTKTWQHFCSQQRHLFVVGQTESVGPDEEVRFT